MGLGSLAKDSCAFGADKRRKARKSETTDGLGRQGYDVLDRRLVGRKNREYAGVGASWSRQHVLGVRWDVDQASRVPSR